VMRGIAARLSLRRAAVGVWLDRKCAVRVSVYECPVFGYCNFSDQNIRVHMSRCVLVSVCNCVMFGHVYRCVYMCR